MCHTLWNQAQPHKHLRKIRQHFTSITKFKSKLTGWKKSYLFDGASITWCIFSVLSNGNLLKFWNFVSQCRWLKKKCGGWRGDGCSPSVFYKNLVVMIIIVLVNTDRVPILVQSLLVLWLWARHSDSFLSSEKWGSKFLRFLGGLNELI